MTSDQQIKAPSAEDMGLFLGKLAGKIQEHSLVEAARNRKTAEKFSPFRYVDLDENMSSSILADLLNPVGEHGQGRLFLDNFLELCGLSEAFFPSEAALYVRTEALTYSIQNSSRRIDILLTSQGRSLAIENKIWAEDQKEQALDYLGHLKNTASNGFHLVYLAPLGRHISEHSLPEPKRTEFKGAFCEVSWQELLECLNECKNQVKANKLNFFLDDFIRAMNKTIGIIMEENMMFLEQISESEKNLIAAYECYKEYPQVVEQLILNRIKIVQDAIDKKPELKSKSFTCKMGDSFNLDSRLNKPLIFSNPDGERENLALILEAGAPHLGAMYMAIYWTGDPNNESPDLVKQINDFFSTHFQNGKIAKSYPWYTYLSDYWSDWGKPSTLWALRSVELTEPENEMLKLCELFAKFLTLRHK